MSKTFLLLLPAFAIGIGAAEFEETKNSSLTEDPIRAMQRFRVPSGFKVELFAAEPYLANPVAFTIDNNGNFYVAETYRHSAVGPAFRYFEGVLDIRSHLDWLDEDLALRSVPERVSMLVNRLGTNLTKFTEKSEIVRLVQDKNGDGKADSSSVFASGFDQIPDGIGAGVLARDGKVWYTCIPDLWQLADTNGDGKADRRESLHTGYGVHISFIGHDLHGLKMGPDGRLYFSIGDRGINVTNKEGKVLFYSDEGVVLRCEPDGSSLEVFARGLRNPQELVFDQYGNLFTGDNNSDGGDRARWVYVVEGGDSGWRIGYQHMHAPPRRGPWNGEKLWYPRWEGQAAYIVPPIMNLGYGPSGNTFYPGTGLPEKYANHFFLTDFRGGASSGIHSFTLKPRGASFELDSYEQFAWECLPTDVDFGPDGAMYFTDWLQGWNKTGKGRIYRVSHPESRSRPEVGETLRLLRNGLAAQGAVETFPLLRHVDMRVRQEAQFALAKQGKIVAPELQGIALHESHQLARIHALWALGQIARKEKDSSVVVPLIPLFKDGDPEIRAQAAKIVGEAAPQEGYPALVDLLRDESPRVEFVAALALAHYGKGQSVQSLLGLLERDAGRDPYLRHAAAFALAASASSSDLAFASTSSASTELGVLLALRRQESPKISKFLRAGSINVVIEAARAINDVPIKEALVDLAALIEEPARFTNSSASKVGPSTKSAVAASVSNVAPEPEGTAPYEQLMSRVINANFRLGQKQNASRLAQFASDGRMPASLRAEALSALADWAHPSGKDRIVNLWRPLPARSKEPAEKELLARLKAILSDSPESVQLAAVEAVQKLGVVKAEPYLANLLRNARAPGAVRVRSLRAVATLFPKRVEPALQSARASGDPLLMNEARLIHAELHPADAVTELTRVLESGSISERQQVLGLLGQIKTAEFATLVEEQMALLLQGKAPRELELDILSAAAKQGTAPLLASVERFENARPKTNVAPFRETLFGGDAKAGRAIFFERADVFCSRCHSVGSEGGQAGPNLTGLGARKPREYILESILFPNKEIAQGWENALVTAQDGTSYAGTVLKDDSTGLILNSPEDGEVRLKKSEIKSRQRALSAMPEEFRQILAKQDLRDLVEFLASQK